MWKKIIRFPKFNFLFKFTKGRSSRYDYVAAGLPVPPFVSPVALNSLFLLNPLVTD